MDPARYKAMDAQRFDPMRCTGSNPPSKIGISKLTMGQGLCVKNHPSAFPVRDTVGGIWPDHEVVIVPLSGDSDSATSTSHASTSTSDASTNTRAPPPTLADFVVVPPSHPQVQVHDRDGLIITRTIIRPDRTPTLTQAFSSPSSTSLPRSAQSRRVARSAPPNHVARSAPSSRAASPSPSHSSRPTSPVLRALNCFRTQSAFEGDLTDVHAERDARPALHVIVRQTREQYEDNIAFKQLVERVYPAASGRI